MTDSHAEEKRSSKGQVKPTQGPYKVRPVVRDGKRVLEIYTDRYGFIVATVEPDDPEMRATAEIMAQSWTRYQEELRAHEPPASIEMQNALAYLRTVELACDARDDRQAVTYLGQVSALLRRLALPSRAVLTPCRWCDRPDAIALLQELHDYQADAWNPVYWRPKIALLLAETKPVTNGDMKLTCPNCGHEPCAEWCTVSEGASHG